MENTQFVFASRPRGMASAENFRKETVPPGKIQNNEVLLKSMLISVDPYMRGRMNDAKSYAASWKPGDAIRGGVVAEVVDSRSSFLAPGDVVTGELPWALYSIADAGKLRKIDVIKYPPEYYLSILGMTGMTAYFGMTDICKPERCETVVVSGAAGAVGLVAGQIAKINEAIVIGIAGSEDKCRMLTGEYGFDESINYKTSKSLRKEIAKLAPAGVNAYFDNVGGDITEAVASNLAFHSRIALCGQISQYNSTRMPAGSFIMSMLLTRSVMLKGYIVRDYASRFDEALAYLTKWIDEGKLKFTCTVVEGFDNLPDSFLGLFQGRNTGKMLVRVEQN